MQRVTRSTAVATMPSAPASPSAPGFFSGGNPALGQAATTPGFEWFNGVQEELVGLLTRAGVTPAQADLTQLRQSLDRLYGGAYTVLTTNATLTADMAGLVVVDATAGPLTITLPAGSAANNRPIRYHIVRQDSSANTVTIQRAGSDLFFGNATSISLPRQSSMSLISSGFSAWYVLSEGSATGRSLASSGYYTLPGGLIMQWGAVLVPTSTALTWTYPIAFPAAVFGVWGTANPVTVPSAEIISVGGVGLTSAVVDNSPGTNAVSAYVFAIGR
jgi:hypothetical protein